MGDREVSKSLSLEQFKQRLDVALSAVGDTVVLGPGSALSELFCRLGDCVISGQFAMLGRPGGCAARVWRVFAPLEVSVRSRGAAAAPGCPQHGAAGMIPHELPGSVQHESVAADRGFCSPQKVRSFSPAFTVFGGEQFQVFQHSVS